MFGEGPLSVMSLSVSRQTVSAILLCLLLLPPYHEIPLMGTCGWMDGWIDDDCLEEGPPDRDPAAGGAVDAVAKVIREAARAAVAVANSSHTAVGVGVGVAYSIENDGVEGGDTVDVAAVGIIDLVADVRAPVSVDCA
jgi:hypothetical protein